MKIDIKPDESNAHFIDTTITVMYQVEPLLEKKPRCPDAFEWDGQIFSIREQIMEWVDYTRRGRMARNMSDAHSKAASGKGSWGVGRFFFRVLTINNRCFDIYYDRAPKGLASRKGQWFIFREFINKSEE
jgi:hypothetical protein